MFRHVPNALTGLRLVLALVFFAMLAWYQYEGRGNWLLNVAFVVYVIALVTDFLDGYLARRWHVEGAFGRIVDPFVDKILVLGTFIFFAGKNFVIPDPSFPASDNVFRTITGVAPGIVVILLGRELLVTSLRGAAESAGENFGAAFAGKFKMGFQSGTILAILLYVNYHERLLEMGTEPIARYIRNFGIWGTVAITLFSGIQYIQKAVVLYRAQKVS
ncbi:MAG TPA: CDP-alcohol phosphatidyltransferase family protein [Tepidisphaeraceae bacterium]|jgi:phosphatidylglycerophosphate synthase|nr:CDP-alcohol phosphatidyltransferase family protein [Tepidisphaeraceae bacterium]